MVVLALVIVAVALFAPPPAEPAGPAPVPIAFAGVKWPSDLSAPTASIYTMRADGSHRRRLTGAGDWTDTNPEWSRDGKRVAFGRYDARGWRILVTGASGRNERAVTSRRSLAEAPTWSPDGRSIAFAALPQRLPMRGSVSQQIYIASISTGRIRQLTPNARFPGGSGLPAWSPDGKRIAFAARRSGADNAASDVWTIGPGGSHVRLVVRNADAPAWSPDGGRIAFPRNGDIYTVTPPGAVRRVTDTPRARDSDPSWCRDGARIAFATTHRAADQRNDDMWITIAEADGSRARTLRDHDPLFWTDSPSC